jgi:hypothetical protein
MPTPASHLCCCPSVVGSAIGSIVFKTLETLDGCEENLASHFVPDSEPIGGFFRSETRAYLRSVSFGQ